MTDHTPTEAPALSVAAVIEEAERLLAGWDAVTDPAFSEAACELSFIEDGYPRGDAEMFARGAGIIRQLLALLSVERQQPSETVLERPRHMATCESVRCCIENTRSHIRGNCTCGAVALRDEGAAMTDRKTPEEATRVVIANKAALRGADSVVVVDVPDDGHTNALVFQWSRAGIGFGELTLSESVDGDLRIDTEAMSGGFCLDVIRQALAAPAVSPSPLLTALRDLEAEMTEALESGALFNPEMFGLMLKREGRGFDNPILRWRNRLGALLKSEAP